MVNRMINENGQMQVIDYFQSDRQEHWLSQIEKSDWNAGKYLYELLRKKELKKLAKENNVRDVYISTNHTGLYEKYGCEFYRMINDMHGEPSRVYVKHFG